MKLKKIKNKLAHHPHTPQARSVTLHPQTRLAENTLHPRARMTDIKSMLRFSYHSLPKVLEKCWLRGALITHGTIELAQAISSRYNVRITLRDELLPVCDVDGRRVITRTPGHKALVALKG